MRRNARGEKGGLTSSSSFGQMSTTRMYFSTSGSVEEPNLRLTGGATSFVKAELEPPMSTFTTAGREPPVVVVLRSSGGGGGA